MDKDNDKDKDKDKGKDKDKDKSAMISEEEPSGGDGGLASTATSFRWKLLAYLAKKGANMHQ
jgi:hypothetical protein